MGEENNKNKYFARFFAPKSPKPLQEGGGGGGGELPFEKVWMLVRKFEINT